MKYLILMCGSQQDYDAMAGNAGAGEPAWSAAELAAMGAFMESFGKDLAESGELVDAQGLTAPVHTRRIRLRAGAPVVTDGPYAETEEVLAGYWLIDCDSFDRATELAARLTACPGPEHVRDRAYVDVRPAAESDDTLILLFLCCHQALSPASQIALTLRAVGGLTTAEIARAFLVPEAT